MWEESASFSLAEVSLLWLRPASRRADKGQPLLAAVTIEDTHTPHVTAEDTHTPHVMSPQRKHTPRPALACLAAKGQRRSSLIIGLGGQLMARRARRPASLGAVSLFCRLGPGVGCSFWPTHHSSVGQNALGQGLRDPLSFADKKGQTHILHHGGPAAGQLIRRLCVCDL